jgi:hypothetical protein
MSKSRTLATLIGLLLMAACSRGSLLGGTAGAVGGYAVDGGRGALLGGAGGAILGDVIDR